MKVKFFMSRQHNMLDLETTINNWLTDKDVEVVDIKFATAPKKVADIESYLCAMIIYKEK